MHRSSLCLMLLLQLHRIGANFFRNFEEFIFREEGRIAMEVLKSGQWPFSVISSLVYSISHLKAVANCTQRFTRRYRQTQRDRNQLCSGSNCNDQRLDRWANGCRRVYEAYDNRSHIQCKVVNTMWRSVDILMFYLFDRMKKNSVDSDRGIVYRKWKVQSTS